jgi:hypothetical protein
MFEMNDKCIRHCNEYMKRKYIELEGCSEKYKMRDVVFSTFNHLSIYFPDAYKHMLKVWEISNEDN